METFHMIDIISLAGLPYPPNGKSSYYVQCPCCDSGRHKHMNINLKKEVFRCPKCGIHGGMFDLYALYTGVPRNEVRKAIADKLKPQGNVKIPQRQPYTPQEDIEAPIADTETRHAVYSALLSEISLAQDHRQNLLNRGLSNDDIEQLGYKTTPIVGMTTLAGRLESDGHNLSGVPGFFRDSNNSWTFVQAQRGILVPVRDMESHIQGLQIRRDNVQKRKFRWFSSPERKDGCQSKGWTHISGPVRPTMLLTEGPMKADVIYKLSDLSVIAVPGVNSLTHLRACLEILREKGLREIKTAFDMDFMINRHVQKGYNDLLYLLDEMGFKFGTYLWNPKYKGLDDYLYALKS